MAIGTMFCHEPIPVWLSLVVGCALLLSASARLPGSCISDGGACSTTSLTASPCCNGASSCIPSSALGTFSFCSPPKLPFVPEGLRKSELSPPKKLSLTSRELSKGWSILKTAGSPQGRHEATFVVGDNNKAYLLGGRGNRPVNVLDLNTNTWSSASYPPEEIHHFQAVYQGGLVWIPVSWKGEYPYEKNVDKFYVYDTAADKWYTKTPLPENRRRGSAAVAFHAGKLYVAMGNIGGHGEHAETLGWLDEYDPATDTWKSDFPAAPNPRDHTGGGIVNGRFCVAGGRNGGVASFFTTPVVETNCFNFGTSKWETEASIPDGRAGSSYGVDCYGRLVVAGGEGKGSAYSRVDYFDGNNWKSPTYMSHARHGSGVAVGNCKCGNLYVASGGGTQGGSNELTSTEIYAPRAKQC